MSAPTLGVVVSRVDVKVADSARHPRNAVSHLIARSKSPMDAAPEASHQSSGAAAASLSEDAVALAWQSLHTLLLPVLEIPTGQALSTHVSHFQVYPLCTAEAPIIFPAV
jgi:hypothetical protein